MVSEGQTAGDTGAPAVATSPADSSTTLAVAAVVLLVVVVLCVLPLLIFVLRPDMKPAFLGGGPSKGQALMAPTSSSTMASRPTLPSSVSETSTSAATTQMYDVEVMLDED